jgi:hypothetical protein
MLGADLNLLVALDALLAEGSVAGAARRLGLSSSAIVRRREILCSSAPGEAWRRAPALPSYAIVFIR